MNEAIIADTPHAISYFQLATVKGALKLESKGMRHSRLGTIRKGWAIRLGLKPSTKYPELIAHIEGLLAKMLEEKRSGAV